MYKTLFISLVFLAISGCIQSDTDHKTVKNAIMTANDQLESAYLSGNASTIAEMMTQEVIISPIQLNDINGREEVESILSQLFKTSQVVQYNLKPTEIEVYEDVAYDRGNYVWISVTNGDTTTVNGRYSAVRHLGSDGKWRVHRLIENRVPLN